MGEGHVVSCYGICLKSIGMGRINQTLCLLRMLSMRAGNGSVIEPVGFKTCPSSHTTPKNKLKNRKNESDLTVFVRVYLQPAWRLQIVW
jgi:hypothetical protein